jgi:serine/threonine-protein kinase RsbW
MSVSQPSPESPAQARFSVRNCPIEVERLQTELVELANRFIYPKASVFALRLALQEAVSNAFRHGHRALAQDVPVVVEFFVDSHRFRIRVEDAGPGFDPTSVPDPTLEANLNVASGRGLFIIKAYMESVSYSEKGNQVEMIYKRPPNSQI